MDARFICISIDTCDYCHHGDPKKQEYNGEEETGSRQHCTIKSHRDLACVDSWRPSVTTSKWCEYRMASTDRPSPPHGLQRRAAYFPQRYLMWWWIMLSEPGWKWQCRNRGSLATSLERSSGGAWESSMPMMAWWYHKTRTSWNTQCAYRLASS